MSQHGTDTFSVAPGSSEPIYRQLMEQVSRLIAGGQFRPGDVLPSVRDLASALAVNPMTISKAYGMLEFAGVLVRRRGIGMEVASHQSTHLEARLALLRPSLVQAVRAAHELEIDVATATTLFKQMLEETK